MFDIAQMLYQHEIEEKGVFKLCTIFNLYKLLKLFQTATPIITLTIWYVTAFLNQGFTCGNTHLCCAKQLFSNTFYSAVTYGIP